jgi:hypothetical protein
MSSKRKSAKKTILIRVTAEDFQKLKADQRRKSVHSPSLISYSDLAHSDWFEKLIEPPQQRRDGTAHVKWEVEAAGKMASKKTKGKK